MDTDANHRGYKGIMLRGVYEHTVQPVIIHYQKFFSMIWRKNKKEVVKKSEDSGFKEFPRVLSIHFGGWCGC